jgi:hypothetical protein
VGRAGRLGGRRRRTGHHPLGRRDDPLNCRRTRGRRKNHSRGR